MFYKNWALSFSFVERIEAYYHKNDKVGLNVQLPLLKQEKKLIPFKMKQAHL